MELLLCYNLRICNAFAGIPRMPRWPQVLFPLPQWYDFRSEGLCLQLVFQRRLCCVQGLLQPQRPDWCRTWEGGKARTIGRRSITSWHTTSRQSQSRISATCRQATSQGWSAHFVVLTAQRGTERSRSSVQRYYHARRPNSELFTTQLGIKNLFGFWIFINEFPYFIYLI